MLNAETRFRVLVVDDERIIADSLALILRNRGFDSRTAYSGEDAASLASEWRPHAVVTDVVMGEMNGIALATFLAQALPSCKVLLMSGNTLAGELLAASEERGYSFPILAKPFSPNSLLEFLAPPAMPSN
jgi:DNA-binding NtrC family response regulator